MYYLRGKKILKNQFGVGNKKLCCFNFFFNPWAVWVAPKNVKNKILNFLFHGIHPYLQEKI
jgi:hypothetical protein